MRPHGVLNDIDPRFTSKFYRAFQWALGIKIKMSPMFHHNCRGYVKSMCLEMTRRLGETYEISGIYI